MADKPTLRMSFDMNTIQHLGLSMYSKLPPVIAEIVANSYDADAEAVEIYLMDSDMDNKSIKIIDYGDGMSVDDINQRFLIIGRNRRTNERGDTTKKGRKILGKKGIGKLSIFGISDEVTITTVKDNIKNRFTMSWKNIKESATNEYFPVHDIVDERTDEKNGTTLEMKKLRRKSQFEPEKLAVDLARRFLIFDKSFNTKIIYNENKAEAIDVTNDLRFDSVNVEFTWDVPSETIQLEDLESKYSEFDKVTGRIFTSEKPLPSKLKGIYLMARGKLVNENEFYGLGAESFAYEYMTGWLQVDFLDEDFDLDLTASNRASLNWENERTEELREYLKELIRYIAQEWRKERGKKKKSKIKEATGVDVLEWIQKLPAHEKRLAKQITESIIDSKLDVEQSTELVHYVQDMFGFDSFKKFAGELDELDRLDEVSLLQFIKDWKVIEAKEMYKLAIVRIESIIKFKKYIDENAKEIPTVHHFLKEFPWLLDPRMMNFKDEVRYSDLLREEFKEPDTVPESDRRIDFLCVDFSERLIIIELKRPHHKVTKKDLDQVHNYVTFIKENIGNHPTLSKGGKVEAYIICGGIVNTPNVRGLVDTYEKAGTAYVRYYTELLQQAHDYHQEFIDKYEEMKDVKEDEKLRSLFDFQGE